MDLSPDLVVAPGEQLLVRFEFDPKLNYAGWLILKSEHGYREYHLPDSGLALAFGTGAPNSRVIALSNSGDRPETYHLTFSRESANTLKGGDDLFADVIVSRYDPAHAAVRVDALMPTYQVTATVSAEGWIETSRVFLPGYRATLNGQPVELRRSHRGLAMAAVGPGTHHLELRYAGSRGLWLALGVSTLTWLAWLVMGLRRMLCAQAKRLICDGD